MGHPLERAIGPATRAPSRLRARTGGTTGNEILTAAAAVVLILLLAAEGITIVDLRGLLSPHMFIGLALLPPVALKLGSTGYRFARYYLRSDAYRRKGPPPAALRMLAPLLVVSTVVVLVTGTLLLAAGHRSGSLLELHKLSFIVFAVAFVPHLLVHLPRVVRSLRGDWRAARRRSVPGSSTRAMLVALAVGRGLALAVALLPSITHWHVPSRHADHEREAAYVAPRR
jgi:hypothetical protein